MLDLYIDNDKPLTEKQAFGFWLRAMEDTTDYYDKDFKTWVNSQDCMLTRIWHFDKLTFNSKECQIYCNCGRVYLIADLDVLHTVRIFDFNNQEHAVCRLLIEFIEEVGK